MIFYFSGTGNSLHAARMISAAQGEELISIARELDKTDETLKYALKENGLLGFVYPVYAWAPPKIVLEFIDRLELSGSKPYVFSLCTCGGEEGGTTHVLLKALKKKGLVLDGAFALQMPSNYMVGFDVDTKEVETQKLRHADQLLTEINALLMIRQPGVFRNLPGKWPRLKTAVFNPLFNRFALNNDRFYATDACTGCGLCETVCPVHSITLKERPVWSKACTQCFACINRCPACAIQYGKGTVNKGRYQHPDLKKMPDTEDAAEKERK